MDFRADKPFRLSLYVDPKEKSTSVESPIKISKINDTFNVNDENNKENKGSEPVKKKKNNKPKPGRGRLKDVNAVLFESENENELLKKKRTRSTMKKSQKSAENNNKPVDDSNKENEEYERWLQNITSEFEDIDKFELSVTYDD